jgi:iron complex transport system substrate-binding protein
MGWMLAMKKASEKLIATLLALMGLWSASFGSALAASPQSLDRLDRVASANLCVDQLVLQLADPAQMVTVHWLTREPDDSRMAQVAQAYPANHGQAEELLGYQPDLVFVGSYNSPVANSMMKALGLDIVSVADPLNYDDIRRNIHQIATALKVPARGTVLVDAFDQALLPTRDVLKNRKLKVLVFGSGGYSAGKPGLFHSTLEHVGLINMAAIGENSGWVPMTVEDVLTMQPDILILGDYRPDAPSMAGNIVQHPALATLRQSVPVIHMPTRLWNCGTPMLATAAQFLVQAVNDLTLAGELP